MKWSNHPIPKPYNACLNLQHKVWKKEAKEKQLKRRWKVVNQNPHTTTTTFNHTYIYIYIYSILPHLFFLAPIFIFLRSILHFITFVPLPTSNSPSSRNPKTSIQILLYLPHIIHYILCTRKTYSKQFSFFHFFLNLWYKKIVLK